LIVRLKSIKSKEQDKFQQTDSEYNEMSIQLEITPRLKRLLSENMISVGAHVTGQGTDIWVRVLQPHPRLAVTTNESMTVSEAEERLAKLDTPLKVEMKLSQGRVHLRRVTPPETDNWDMALAARVSPKTITRGGVVNQLPSDSLCKGDLGLSAYELQARARVVSEKLGHAKLISRIRTAGPSMKVSGATTLAEWWDRAGPDKRWTLLSSAKKAGGAIEHPWEWQKVAEINRPFLDTPLDLSTSVEPQGSPEEETWESAAGLQ